MTNLLSVGRNITRVLPMLKPILRPIKRRLYPLPEPKILFSGWGMSTEHQIPWIDEPDFLQTNEDIKKFKFTICNIDSTNIDYLLWRHWNVCFCIRHTINANKKNNPIFVECGVADGMSVFFAMREALKHGVEPVFYLYDSWDSMSEKYLNIDEQKYAGRYQTLSIENTKSNLDEFVNYLKYCQGYIPDSFEQTNPPPKSINYLHIDLNSAKSTKDSLDFFYSRLVSGGLILFDDYGWVEYDGTRKIIDEFLENKYGNLLRLPTGQAIFFKF